MLLRYRLLLPFVVLACVVQAQLATVYPTFTATNTGVYTPVTGGALLASGTFDDAVIPISVTPLFINGNYYDTLKVSTNGFFTVGIAPLVTNYTPLSSTALYKGCVSAFGTNLKSATTGTPQIRVVQVGDEVIVQWQDMARSITSNVERFSFQARMDVVTGTIRFVYSDVINLNSSTTSTTFPQVGLRGVNNGATNVTNIQVGTGGATWAAPAFVHTGTSTMRFTSGTTPRSPTAGQTYTAMPVCLSPVAVATVIPDCASNTFQVITEITALGGAPAATITASTSGTLFSNVGTGTYACGPFTLGTAVTISVANTANSACTNVLGPFNPSPNCITLTNGICTDSPYPAIPDAGCGPGNDLQGVIPISGFNSTLGSSGGQTTFLAIELIIAHTFRGDLQVRLTSPTGQTRELLIQQPSPNASGSNFGTPGACPGGVIQLRDDATQPISSVSPTTNNVGGTFQPEEPLSGFTGNPNGNWVLHVCDNSPDDAGTLRYVRLRFQNNASCTVGTPCNDGNACTTGDVYNASCQCAGTPGTLQATATAGTIACNGGTTTVNVSATGGTQPYTGTGAFTRNAGTYSFTVSDATGCSVNSAPITITQPALLVASASISTPVACHGGNATVTVGATGGTPPYTGTGSFERPSGSWTFTVTDANGCSAQAGLSVSEPATLVAGAVETAPIACDGGNATITVSGSGGTAPYTGTGSFSRPAGTWNFPITDAHGCAAQASITITAPAPLAASALVTTPIACNGGNAVVTVSASGGTAPYTGTGTFARAAGTWSFTVTDAHGCSAQAGATITSPPALSAQALVGIPVACHGDIASVDVSGSGGTPPYAGEGSFARFAGTYGFTVFDANNCSAQAQVTVTEAAVLTASAQLVSEESGCGAHDAVVLVSASGGTTPYTGTGSLGNLGAGSNNFQVSDAHGCTANTSYTVPQPDSDDDGLNDCVDPCPTGSNPGSVCNDNNACTINDVIGANCACSGTFQDGDGDGVCDVLDGCPSDPNKTSPGICGCGFSDADSDNDGTPNCNDGCPSDANKTSPGACGCGFSDSDSDGDGTPDCNDLCASDPNKVAPGICGCGISDADSDNDGTPNCNDGCPSDANKTSPGTCGCGVSDADSDNDGTANCNDLCPNDPNKVAPGICGCGFSDSDSDGDGTPDCNDLCASDPNKVTPGICGCGFSDTDSDGDGTPDCNDLCASDPNKVTPGICGCGFSDADSDNDGTANCTDGCPSDANKTSPGACGCGFSDSDSDGDGTPDCNDLCASDPNKVTPGICGCGISDADSDNDGTANCNDGCPSDATKTAPGLCGCGAPEPGAACNDGDGGTDNDVIGANCVCAGTAAGVRVSVQAILEGPYVAALSLMRDNLRSMGLLPASEPYTTLGFTHVGGGGETMGAGVTTVTGPNAITDWVMVQLRDAGSGSTVLATRSALLQRDGDVVDMDGTSPVLFSAPGGNYHVALLHRNHLAVMTAGTFLLSATSTDIDLRDGSTATYGTQAQKTIGAVRASWAGNVKPNAQLHYTGLNNDRDPILVRVGNTTPNATVNGYYAEDVNLDGTVKYTGADNDRDPILVNIGNTTPNNIRLQQLP